MKKSIAKVWANKQVKSDRKWEENPIKTQDKWFRYLIKSGKSTQFGKDFDFEGIKSIDDFRSKVPIQNYENLLPYINEINEKTCDILWKGKPEYFAKTSGTTAGSKYIPITKESLSYQIKSARSMLLHYISTHNADFINGKMIFLQGSPKLSDANGIPAGRLSGIVYHTIPAYLQKNRLPTYKTNCIEDWEKKIDAIVQETMHENMTLISGIPPWLIMYFERLIAASGMKTVKELFPNLQLIVTGGVNYEPYRAKINELIGGEVDILQTFPASEGFFAFQDSEESEGLLLLLDHGIYYEFVELEEMNNENAVRIGLDEVELNKDYAMIISTDAGLWAYNIGDTVRFVNKDPFRIIVSGRVSHYTSAFGEHVIANEIETALQETIREIPIQIREFTVAPQVNPKEGLPYHEWLIEFSEVPVNMDDFSKLLDENLQQRNSYYLDLVQGKVLSPLKIQPLAKDSFIKYLETKGPMDVQNKVPRLANDRKIADILYQINGLGES